MKYVKTLGLLAAVSAFLAFSSAASATTITSSNGSTPTIKASSTNWEMHGSFITVKCSGSEWVGTVTKHGSSVTAVGTVSTWNFTGCNYAVTMPKTGSFEIHSTSSTGRGTVTSSGMEMKAHTSVGECIFTTNQTHIGTLTGGFNPAIHLENTTIPRTGGSFFCGSTGHWTGTYHISSPDHLEVH
jgi:hypothetical protein